MSSKWQGLAQEKLFLAQSLFREATRTSEPLADTDIGRPGAAGLQAGLIQGGVALLLQAREAMLVLTAQLNQSKATDVADLAGLAEAVGKDNADLERLTELSQDRSSWWHQLDQLQQWLKQPRQIPEHVDNTSLIAVAAASQGPDTSPQALLGLAAEIKQYLAELTQWHGEW